MVKSYPIKYQGRDETIEIVEADRVKAGVIMPIIKRCLKYKQGQSLPEIDTDEWFAGIATNCITKAPWQLNNIEVIRNLDFQDQEQLIYILGDEYPMERFLSLGAKLMYGRKLEVSISDFQTASTTSSASGESPSNK